MNPTLYYFHDPMCSWCWGYRPSWLRLLSLLPETIDVSYIVGGLAPDSNTPMTEEMALTIQSHWRRIESELGTRFNYNFWTQCTPKRSTYPACRAVLAAKNQQQETQMIQSIQESYYLRALNPSELSTLVQLAEEIGLDRTAFISDINSIEVQQELESQIQFARTLQVPGFPSLVLVKNDNTYPISVDYKNPDNTIKVIKSYEC